MKEKKETKTKKHDSGGILLPNKLFNVDVEELKVYA